MGSTIKITIPGEADLSFFEQIGHIVFKMDQLKDSDMIMQTLVNHISGNKHKEPVDQEHESRKATLEQINNKAEI